MSRVTARRHRGARARTPRPTTSPALNSAAERVLREMELWWPAFARGELAPSAGEAPPPVSGERFAVQLPGVRAVGLGLPATSGILFATDRRAVISGDRSRPPRAWVHQDLCAVEALGNWGGVALVHAGGETELVVSAALEVPTWRDAAGWLKVEAAFAAASDRLDAWIDQLPGRLALVAGA